ncbi:MAG: HAD hydrolase family protein [Micropruina glycogenica]
MLDQLRRTVPSGVVPTCSGRGSIDLIADDVKGTALQWLANRLGLRVDDAGAFGDGGHDAELLAVVGHGVAMANAPDWLRARADDVAASNSEAGVRA